MNLPKSSILVLLVLIILFMLHCSLHLPTTSILAQISWQTPITSSHKIIIIIIIINTTLFARKLPQQHETENVKAK